LARRERTLHAREEGKQSIGFKSAKMTDRAPGTRRNTGLVLMAIGVALLLFFIVLSIGEITPLIAWVGGVVFIAGIAALAAGAVFYMLARSRPS
jgi:hypothetical protein